MRSPVLSALLLVFALLTAACAAEGPDTTRTRSPAEGLFRVTLTSETETAPSMHRGRKLGLREVLLRDVGAPVPAVGHTDLSPLTLSGAHLDQLKAFLRRLSAPIDASSVWLSAPSQP